MAAPSPLSSADAVRRALKGCCPRCGQAPLFAGWVKFAPRCTACGLDFQSFNVGDGPAAFLTLIIGTLVTILAVILELSVEPPWWVHIVVWTPLTLVSVMASLRLAKAALLALEFRREAREGRLHRDDA